MRFKALSRSDAATLCRVKALAAAAASKAAAAVAASPRPRPIWEATDAERAEHHAICQEMLALLGAGSSHPRYCGRTVATR